VKEATAMTDNNENTEYVSHIRRNARATTKTNWFVEWNAKRKEKYNGTLFKTQRKQIDDFNKLIVSRIT
jgi:hypothetical protein